jgi:integrase
MANISERIVAELPHPDPIRKSKNKLHYFSGAMLQGKRAPSGFAVRVTAAGTKSFVWFHRVKGKPFLETIGTWERNPSGGKYSVRDAIIEADRRAKAVRDRNEDPRPERTRRLAEKETPAGETISDLLDTFVDRYVLKEKNLRSAPLIKQTLDRLVKPKIGKIGVYELRRNHIVALLDEIADERGPVMADRTLAMLRKCFNWRATRDDDFRPPIVRGMERSNQKERARSRTLTDQEIRDLWAALERVSEPACYPSFIRALLLTAGRRTEVSDMRWDEIDGDTWVVPGSRYKTGIDHVVPLTGAVRDAIGKRPANFQKRPFVFSATAGAKPFGDYARIKSSLDEAIAAVRAEAGREPMPHWTLHDLRRSARSLMSRAGVSSDHAERALGHVMGGVRGTYDRHEYLDEKRAAFQALATLVSRILNPTANVEELASRRAGER